MDMQMTFSTALPIQVLFSSWNVITPSDYAWTFAVVLCMGFFRQFLVAARYEMVTANGPARRKRNGGALLEADDGAAGTVPISPTMWMRPALSSASLRRSAPLLRLVDVVFFGLILTLSYLNMLVVMAYNPGLMMAIVLGEMLGMALFQPIGGHALAKGGNDADEEGCCT